MENIFFWWSVFSTLIAIGLLGWDIWQLSANKKEREIHKSQVKLWQHHASGLMQGIIITAKEQFSSVKDIQQAIEVSKASAFSLYKSLNEERLFSEEEIKLKQLETEEELKKQREMKPKG